MQWTEERPQLPHADRVSRVLKEFRTVLCPKARLFSSNPFARARSSKRPPSAPPQAASSWLTLHSCCMACRCVRVELRWCIIWGHSSKLRLRDIWYLVASGQSESQLQRWHQFWARLEFMPRQEVVDFAADGDGGQAFHATFEGKHLCGRGGTVLPVYPG